jgi:hypothetical protein
MTDVSGGGVGGGSADILHREARIMARVTEDARVKGRTASEALANIADGVRYTFEYPADQYTDAVHADIERLWHEGYTELTVRNYWTTDVWKGISTSWQEPATGQLFEVQFHTPESLAARELTYPGYRRLRDPATPDAERASIMARAREVYAGEPAANAPATEKERAEARRARDLEAQRLRSARFRVPVMDPRAEQVTYYCVMDRYSGEDSPAGVVRRIVHADGQRDEAFGRDLRWRHTFLLYSWERGNLDNSLHEIGEDRGLRFTDQIRRAATSHGGGIRAREPPAELRPKRSNETGAIMAQ